VPEDLGDPERRDPDVTYVEIVESVCAVPEDPGDPEYSDPNIRAAVEIITSAGVKGQVRVAERNLWSYFRVAIIRVVSKPRT
jgi:hypothetical protein